MLFLPKGCRQWMEGKNTDVISATGRPTQPGMHNPSTTPNTTIGIGLSDSYNG
jgi:hypothetical protein